MSKENIFSVETYFKKGPYTIPCYQRGYKWSLSDDEKNPLKVLLEDLLTAFKQNEKEYHLQGITVKKVDGGYSLVDGQQRTTSLYLLLLALGKSEIIKEKIDYKVRKSVKEWLRIKFESPFDKIFEVRVDDRIFKVKDVQDLAAFDKAWEVINEFCKKLEDMNTFANFLLQNVKIIFVERNTDPAKVFSMMNKDKAFMTQTDLIKAILLSEASRQAFVDVNDDGESAQDNEWQINHIRSHYAREWDKWRKWWEDHHDFFGALAPKPKNSPSGEPDLARLFRIYHKCHQGEDELTFENYRAEYEKLIQDSDGDSGNRRIEAVETFDGLRKLQLILQEWYEDPAIHNWIGLIRCGSNGKDSDIMDLIKRYEKNKSEDSFKGKYIHLSKVEKFPEGDHYHDHYEFIASQLLRRNVLMLNEHKIKFDFSMYSNKSQNAEKRSIEHIEAQSHFFNDDELSEDQKGSDTSKEKKCICRKMGNRIGNLVLLPKGVNSGLGAKSFDEKKKKVWSHLTDSSKSGGPKMTLFMHTLDKFSKSEWDEAEIKKNEDEFKKDINEFYDLKQTKQTAQQK